MLPKFSLPLAGGVPVTAQSMGIMLAGVMLGPVRGALAVCLFLLVVALGAPLLAGGRGGLGVFAGPSAGFLFGFPVAALVTGLLMQTLKSMSVFWSACIASLVGGIFVMYLFGIPGIMLTTDLDARSAFMAVLIFIPGDLIKIVLTGLLAKTVAKGYPDALISRNVQ
ncbi:MAG: biotin transporter BioY [Gammaproteobacteria bacterium]|nr:biotin transporter BioY [Gammaproteobacteria bacterium]